eukprot:13346061-Alexandrium_andersonii.AAC.1
MCIRDSTHTEREAAWRPRGAAHPPTRPSAVSTAPGICRCWQLLSLHLEEVSPRAPAGQAAMQRGREAEGQR